MELSLTRTEKETLKKVIAQKPVRPALIPPANIALLVGGMLLLGPLIFIMTNIGNVDHIFKTVGVYLGMMLFSGAMLGFYSVQLSRQHRRDKEVAVVYSVVRKMSAAGMMAID